MNLVMIKNTILHITRVALSSALLFAVLGACKSEKKEEPKGVEEAEIIQYEESEQEKKQVITMGDFDRTDSVKVGEKSYVYRIARTANDAKIKDEEGYSTKDNTIKLVVKRNGKELLSRDFTRDDFSEYIPKAEFQHYVLMNIVFDKVVEGTVQFAATVGVGSADDMFQQFLISVAPGGDCSIEKHDVFDPDELGMENDVDV